MKGIILATILSVFIAVVYGNGDKINDGASTSGTGRTAHDSEHTCDYCILERYAHRLVYLILSEDTNQASVRDTLISNPEEIEAFHDEVYNCLYHAQLGLRTETEVTPADSNAKLDFFSFKVSDILYRILQKTSTEHYRSKIWSDYDRSTRSFNLRENTTSRRDHCMCQERLNINSSITLPLAKTPHTTTIRLTKDNNVMFEDVTMYHIIPISLISRFFRAWLGDGDACFNSNGCLNDLFKRIKRSMLKILMVSIMRSRVYSNQPVDNMSESTNDFRTADDTFGSNHLVNALSWSAGNIYVGPSNRGPFNPDFRKSREELLHAFDFEARHLISEDHYRNLENIYNRLHNFIQRALILRPFSRLLAGFNLLTSMTMILRRYPITTLDIRHWELRAPRIEELRDIGSDFLVQLLMSIEFWSIKNTHSRQPRSVLLQEIKNTVSEGQKVKTHWRKFINNVLQVSMAAQYENEDLPWLCNFTRLYDEYLYRKSVQNQDDCSSCITFDEFLYSKISTSYDWHRCNHETNLTPVDNWCGSWRHIMNQNNQEDPDDPFNIELPKWKYLEDMETMMQWVLLKTEEKNLSKELKENTYQYKIEKIPTNLFQLVGENSVTDIAMCLFTVFTASVSVANHRCLKLG